MATKHFRSFAIIVMVTLLAVAGSPAFATTISVQGYYIIGTSGLTGNAPGIVDDLKSGTSGSHINFSLSVPTTGSTTTNFLQFDPASSSGISNAGNCYGSCNNSHNDIVSEMVTATFDFTLPTGDSAAAVVTGEFYANYDGKLDGTEGGTNPISCGDSGSPADCIVWNSGTPFTATFGNGDVLTVALNNAHDWDITSTATFGMTVPTAVPEPASLALLVVGLLSTVVCGRRRRA